MYAFRSRVRYSEIACDGLLSLDGLLNYFQDVSTFQSEELGIGVEYLQQYHMAWVLSSWQIQVNRYPKLGEEIEAVTYPYAFKGFFGMRNFLLKTPQGEVLACANSIWTLLDMNEYRPVKPTPLMVEKYVLEEQYPMEYCGRKIQYTTEARQMEPILVTKAHLDTNMHVNNGQYVRLAMDYVPENCVVSRLRVEYKKSAKAKDVMYPAVYQEEDNRMVVCLNEEQGKPYAVIEFLLEKV